MAKSALQTAKSHTANKIMVKSTSRNQPNNGQDLKMPWDKGTTVIDAYFYGHRIDEISIKHTDGVGHDYRLVQLKDLEGEIPEFVTRVRAMIKATIPKIDIN